MRINYNVAAMRANNALNISDRKVSKSLEKLSSGLKITQAKDAPAGYAIGRRMNAQIEGLSVAFKGATGTLTTTDRSMLQSEMKQLKQEVTRIARDTEFNGQTILDGSFDLKGYTNNNNVKIDYYADEVLSKKYTVDQLTVKYTETGEIDLAATAATCVLGEGFPKGAKITEVDGDKLTITADQGFEIRLKVKADPESVRWIRRSAQMKDSSWRSGSRRSLWTGLALNIRTCLHRTAAARRSWISRERFSMYLMQEAVWVHIRTVWSTPSATSESRRRT